MIKSLSQEEIQVRKISDLKPHPKNPRKHPEEAIEMLAKSMREYGFTDPIEIDMDGFVLSGHCRIKAAQRVGIEEALVVTLPFSGKKSLGYMVAANKIAELSGWDYPKFKDLVVEYDTGENDIENLGFTQDELEVIFEAYKIEGIDAPELRDGDRAPFQQMTFTLHDDQAEEVKRAIDEAKKNGGAISTTNENSNGNALSFVCNRFNNGRC